MEIDAGVRAGHGLDLDRQLEISEIRAVDGPCVEEVRSFAVDDDLAVNNLETALMLTGLPSTEGVAIEKREPIGGILHPGAGGSGGGGQHGEDFAARKFRHWVSWKAGLQATQY